MTVRKSGVLLPVSSLPSPYGIGDLGPQAYRFVDFLARAGQTLWQVLPLNPILSVNGNSPYQSVSAFGLEPLFISPERMVDDGLLEQEEIEPWPEFPDERVDYRGTSGYKRRLFDSAYARFRERRENNCGFRLFLEKNPFWLDDYTLFVALHDRYQRRPWNEWPAELRDRDAAALAHARDEEQDRIGREQFLQYVAFRQWSALREYCRQRRVQIIGDVPIYVTYDSADVWADPGIFKLDEARSPSVVAGVPPDYFNPDGQLWGNPVYRWDELRRRDYDWWVRRIEHTLTLVDLVRIDHFRGFAGYWEVPAGSPTAANGRWAEGPGADFFNRLARALPCLPFIAEDLGYITADVRELIHTFSFPGIRLLLFGFAGDAASSPFSPHNLAPRCVAYTGTHDSNTARGWFEEETDQHLREQLFRYIGREVSADAVAWELVRLALLSVAETAVIPMQDLLGLGAGARMNRPGVPDGNWEWRATAEQVSDGLADALRELTALSGRL
ncbi:4-alpha-glucanotransferase [Methanoculleus sp. FWC-SCC1]|uniref:4-alpha-glucanotransferase n=1 Tax=Methanoculleus frigidifontis TaxID=2584085 RepID=A0ABT8MEA8_9EURY|nr:4-alpha-glucanotransferase [Methanoculleus sp. FWC-SCC1]MDN7026225.1 4-alpha-glucanotransferase [Methanoculleus sp. FWC-SCC1]